MKTETASATKSLLFLIVTCVLTSLLIKLPALLPELLDETEFYLKNTSFIVFFGMTLYLLLTEKGVKTVHFVWFASILAVLVVYLNVLPSANNNDTIALILMHTALLLWCLFGYLFIGLDRSVGKRLEYIRFNGDLVVLTALFFMAGGLFTAITLGLFNVIGFKIEGFYFGYIGACGAVCIPIVATWVIKNHSLVTNKLAPIIANIFSPLVLLMLLIFLASLPFSEKSPFSDRNFLITFNALLLGVMAIIVFALSETSKNKNQQFNKVVLSLMSVAALIIDGVALAAIVFRLSEFGFTPNRTAALGSNLLLFVHLIWITISLFRATFRKQELELVEITVARYLPVYVLWTLFVILGFPILFGV